MWKITLKNVTSNKVRLALTALAIVLGVAFVSTANVLSDGLRESFGSLAEEITQGTDLQVGAAVENAVLSNSELEQIVAVDGIRHAEGSYDSEWEVFPIRSDGSLVQPQGPPVIAGNWLTDAQLSPAVIETGRAPEGPGEWVIDIDSAANEGFVVGETYELVVPTSDGFATAELVGTFRFGEDNQTNGAVLLAFEGETIAELLGRDNFDEVQIAIDGSRPVAEVQTDVEALMGEDYAVLDTADLNAEISAEFNGFISIFAWVLRGFAIVALFVSVFIIANTFNIVMSQRVRELGLLRAVGATPKQIRRAVLGEALIIGALASVIGVLAGLGLAYGFEALLDSVGAGLPPFAKSLSVATIAIGMATGIGITMLSAYFAARRAGATAPVTAISGNAESAGQSRTSTIIGGVLLAIGSASTGVALFGGVDSTGLLFALLGVGAGMVMIGVTMLSSLVAAPISRALGAPIAKLYRRPGFLAKENAARNPKRTATTAAALMIGLSLVSMAFVLGETLKKDLNALLETTVQADFAAFSNVDGPLPDALFEELDAAPQLSNVAGIRYWGYETTLDGDPDPSWIEVGTMPLDLIDANFNLDLTEGSFADIDSDSVGLIESTADQLDVGMGDVITVPLNDGSDAELTVAAIFASSGIFDGILVTEERFDTIGDQTQYDWIAAGVASDSTLEEASAVIGSLQEQYPQAILQSAAQYRADITGQIDGLLLTLTGFLGLAIFIAFIGIVNTMALSIFERTRELGLLRAVGMTRRQTQRMVRWEAAIVSSVGALFGAAVGTVFAILVVIATPDEVFSSPAIPWVSLGVIVVVAGLVGLVAGVLPARRAGKLNVLDAIAH